MVYPVYFLKYNFRVSLILALLFLPGIMAAQELTEPVSREDHVAILKGAKTKAAEHVANNLNRFGLEKLREYNRLLDSLYALETKDTLNAIETNYLNNSAAGRLRKEEYTRNADELEKVKTRLEDRYYGLLRKAVFAFLAWLAIVLILLQFRKRSLKAMTELVDTNSARESYKEGKAGEARQLIEGYRRSKERFAGMSNGATGFLKQVKETQEKSGSEGSAELVKKAETISMVVERERTIGDAILSQENAWPEEKVKTDINRLCDLYTEIAYRGFSAVDPEFNCKLSKDLEKNLPSIQVIPEAVGSLLLNVLHNAFLAVKEKQVSGAKGYQPAISVSTRILPRFLQIRIRDNGDGMTDNILTRSESEFFTTRRDDQGAGLGMSESSHVINALHKGEMKIESQPGNGTDVYIKFYLS